MRAADGLGGRRRDTHSMACLEGSGAAVRRWKGVRLGRGARLEGALCRMDGDPTALMRSFLDRNRARHVSISQNGGSLSFCPHLKSLVIDCLRVRRCTRAYR